MHLSTLVEIAADLRRKAQQSEPAFSTQQIVSACFPDAVVTGHPLPPNIDEAVSRTSDGVVILYRRGLSTAEQRVAIAHALAHLLFDGPEAACMPGRVGIAEAEARADAFAAELLVPLVELHPHVSVLPDAGDEAIYLDQVDLIASFFHVPAALIDRRIRDLCASRI